MDTLLCGDEFGDKPEIDAELDSEIDQESQALAWVIAEGGTQGGKTDKEKKQPNLRVEANLWAVLVRKVVRQNGQPGGYVSEMIWHEEWEYVLGTADVDERPDTEHVIGEVSQNNLGQNNEDYNRFPNLLLRYV